MKPSSPKRLLPAAGICLLFLSAAATAQERQDKAKLSSGTRKYLRQLAQHDRHCAYHTAGGAKRYVPATIRVHADIDTAQLTRLGVLTGTKAGNIWTVRVPAEELRAFILVEGVDYIQVDDKGMTPQPAE